MEDYDPLFRHLGAIGQKRTTYNGPSQPFSSDRLAAKRMQEHQCLLASQIPFPSILPLMIFP